MSSPSTHEIVRAIVVASGGTPKPADMFENLLEKWLRAEGGTPMPSDGQWQTLRRICVARGATPMPIDGTNDLLRHMSGLGCGCNNREHYMAILRLIDPSNALLHPRGIPHPPAPPEPPVELPPAAPTWDALALNINPTSVELHWFDNSDNETGFKVQMSTVSETGPWTTVETTAADETTFTVPDLTHNTMYWFQVIATNGAGDSASTGPVEITTDNELPLPPSALGHNSEPAPNKANFIWTDNSDNEGGFTLYGRDITAGEMTLNFQADIFGPNVTTLVNHLHNGTGFIPLHNYEYVIRSWNDLGESVDDDNFYSFTYNLV